MRFGALAAWQGWLFIATAVVAAIAVFRIKVRPARFDVPSMAIWRKVLDEPRARSWWDRIRRAVSLALTALIALVLALAAVRPTPGAAGADDGRILLVLDTSWSMSARTSGGATRWQKAVAEARAVAAAAAGQELLLATTADGLVEGPTTDAALIDTTLSRLAPGGTEALAWPRVDDVRATHFFTDGAVPRSLDPGVIVHSVFEPAPNVAVTGFVARPSTSTTAASEAFLEVANFAPAAQQVRIRVVRGTAIVTERDVQIGAGDAWRQVLTLDQTGGPRLGVHVSAPRNAVDVDDDAVAWLAAAEPIAVTVVSDAPEPLERLLRQDANVHSTFVRPAAYRPGEADVLVFDRWVPVERPARPMLCIAPPPVAWLGRAGAEESAPKWVASTDHPVLDGVDPFSLEIARVRSYQSPALSAVALSARGTPIVSVLDSAESRAVVLGFGIADSNIAATPAFPVLMGNALEWLAHPASGEPRTPGPIALSPSVTRITGPDGASLPLVHAGDRVLANLIAPGLYSIDAAGSRRVVGVNVGQPEIANGMRTSLPDAGTPLNVRLSARPWWAYAALAALALLAIEWITWQRRITV